MACARWMVVWWISKGMWGSFGVNHRLIGLSLQRWQRSPHIHTCRKRDLTLKLNRSPRDLHYCYACFQWVITDKWSEYCLPHINNIKSNFDSTSQSLRPGFYCVWRNQGDNDINVRATQLSHKRLKANLEGRDWMENLILFGSPVYMHAFISMSRVRSAMQSPHILFIYINIETRLRTLLCKLFLSASCCCIANLTSSNSLRVLCSWCCESFTSARASCKFFLTACYPFPTALQPR